MATRSPEPEKPAVLPPFSDSWVLLAVAYAGGKRGAELSSVVGVADYINHAILTYEEARASLARLVALGLVRAAGGKLAAAAAVLAVLPKGRSAVHKDLERIKVFLGAKAKLRKPQAKFSLSRAQGSSMRAMRPSSASA